MPQWQQGRCTHDTYQIRTHGPPKTLDTKGIAMPGLGLTAAELAAIAPEAVEAAQAAQRALMIASGDSGKFFHEALNPALKQQSLDLMDSIRRAYNPPAAQANAPAPSNGPEQGFADKSSPAILAVALSLHSALMLLNGFGGPTTGDGLTTGAVVFQDVSALLGSAGSDPGWQGVGAQSYDRQNSKQRARTDQMAALDTELANLLQTQATEVKKLRNEMYIVGGTLAGAIPAAWALYKIPVYGPAISTAFQTATAIACLGADTYRQTQQGMRSQKTGAAMDNVAGGYAQIAADAEAQ
jgi:hypothetical protein